MSINLNKEKSIFSTLEGEHKKFMINHNNLITEVKPIKLSNHEKKILNILNKFFCVTLNQIINITKFSEDCIKEDLNILEINNIINSCEILNKNNNIILTFYFLSKNSKKILENNNISIKEFNIRNKNLIEIKKILEWNELLISVINKNIKIIGFNNDFTIFSKLYNDSIKISGGYVKFDNKNQHYVFEIIREEKNLEIKLMKKITRYKDFYDNYKLIASPPKLILVCEDDNQILTVFNRLIYKKIEQYFYSFTTDSRINNLELINFKFNPNKSKWICIKNYINS